MYSYRHWKNILYYFLRTPSSTFPDFAGGFTMVMHKGLRTVKVRSPL
jgi:hypothetical protein